MLTTFFLAAAVQFLTWGLFYRLAFSPSVLQTSSELSPFPPVSVIVCFRNEETMIQNCLINLLGQKYPGDFEVVAVDDNSTDESAAIVSNLQIDHPDKLRLVQPGPTRPGKKDALTFGIHQSRYGHLLLTDADCLAFSNHWLQRMTRPLREGAEVVLGVSPYAYNGWQFVDRFQRFEATYVALKYLSFARVGMPYMGVGRNLAYQKSFFERAGGFTAHADLPGGDDDLLVGNHALPDKTVCVTHPEARRYSRLSGSWSVFLRQRRRHQSVGFRYRLVHQLLLGGVALSHGLFFLLGFLLLFTEWWKLGLFLYGVRFLLVYGAFRRSGLRGANPAILTGQAAGANKDFKEQAIPPWEVAWADALIAPFYGYLAVVGWLPVRGW